MALYDKASLVLIPSGTKEGVVFSQKPTNGDGDFTFTRASSAIRVNADGLIEKERGNLLLQSNQFDTTWGTTNVSVTSGQSGYDGTNDAWLLTNSASGAHINQSVSDSGVITISVYAKAGTLNWMRLTEYAGSNAWFDLANGVVGSTFSGSNQIERKIESVGGGWYRCSMTTISGGNSFRIYPATNDNDESSLGNIVIQDAQREQSLVATDYIETTTAAVYEGITDNIPRLDYTDASCPSLLLEPQRTNLVTQSEDFSNAAWQKLNVTITPNQGISPDGSNNASKYFGASTNQELKIPITFSNNYTCSCYIKVINSPYIRLRTSDGSCWFNMTTNTVATNTFADAEIKSVGNDWYRLSVTSSSFTSSNVFFIHPHATDNTTSELSGAEFYIFGAQVEESSYPTSYIPTYGSSVTFLSDRAEIINGSFLPTDYPFTMFIEAPIITGKDEDFISFCRSDVSDSYKAIQFQNTSNKVQVQNRIGSTNNILLSSSTYTTGTLKIAYKLTSTEVKLFVNGVEEASSTSVAGFDSVDDLLLGQLRIVTDTNRRSTLNQVLLFPTALTDAECIDLTTI